MEYRRRRLDLGQYHLLPAPGADLLRRIDRPDEGAVSGPRGTGAARWFARLAAAEADAVAVTPSAYGVPMQETAQDLQRLQGLLDASYARAGAHLASIHTPEARLSAAELVRRLEGMQVFVVATTTRAGRPRTGPVDTFLYRGQLRFGTAANAVRARHLARSPAVSATHVRGEALVVTAHGNARPLDLAGPDADFRAFLRDHYGQEFFEDLLAGSPYYGIVADRVFAADMSLHAQGAAE